MVREKIYHEAGAHTAQAMTLDEILRADSRSGAGARWSAIRSTTSCARSTTAPADATAALSACASDGSPTSTAIRSTARSTAASCRCRRELVDGVPTALNRAMAAGTLDVSVISAVEYARDADAYLLLPDLAISCDGPVRSVLLFSKRPARTSQGARVLVSRSSMTSVALLELLFENVWDARARVRAGRRRARRRRALRRRGSRRAPRDRRRGAAPLVATSIAELYPADSGLADYPYAYDLGGEWKQWTGLPFVFAVWVAQRTAPVAEALAVHARLIESRDWGLAHLDDAGGAGGDRHRRRADRLPRVPVGARLRPVVSAPRRTDRVLPAARAPGKFQRLAGVPAGGMTRRRCHPLLAAAS